MAKDDGGPVHPHPLTGEEGIKLRDYFAGQALMGFLANCGEQYASDEDGAFVAGVAYDYADAMLARRKEP